MADAYYLQALEIIRDSVIGWIPLNISWAAGIIIVAISLIMITRNPEEMKKLALPILAGWSAAGLGFNLLITFALGIIWILEIMSLQQMGELIQVASRGIQTTINKKVWEPKSEQRAIIKDISKERFISQEKKRLKKIDFENDPTEKRKEEQTRKRAKEIIMWQKKPVTYEHDLRPIVTDTEGNPIPRGETRSERIKKMLEEEMKRRKGE